MSAVSFQLGVARFELPAHDAEQLQQTLRQHDNPGSHAWDLADRIERARPRGHTVYPAGSELGFLLRALRETEGTLSDTGADLLRAVLREIGQADDGLEHPR